MISRCDGCRERKARRQRSGPSVGESRRFPFHVVENCLRARLVRLCAAVGISECVSAGNASSEYKVTNFNSNRAVKVFILFFYGMRWVPPNPDEERKPVGRGRACRFPDVLFLSFLSSESVVSESEVARLRERETRRKRAVAVKKLYLRMLAAAMSVGISLVWSP